MHRFESEQVGRNAVELGHIVLVKLHSIDSADSAARPEQVRLVVIVNEDLAVKTSQPSVLQRTGVLENSKVCIRTKRVGCSVYVVAVTGNVELAVVLNKMRSNREIDVHRVMLPVQKVVRHPHCTA